LFDQGGSYDTAAGLEGPGKPPAIGVDNFFGVIGPTPVEPFNVKTTRTLLPKLE
jgi:hypothetical protein